MAQYNFIRCIASTLKGQQCKHFTNPHTEMYCKIHRSSIPIKHKTFVFYSLKNKISRNFIFITEICIL